jgi:hypothetical protein
MVNLEELKLYLSVRRYDSIYIDGIQLHDQFLIYMTQLKKFTFSINTEVTLMTDEIKLQPIEDIQRSFVGRGYQPVASYIGPESSPCEGKCHIYSLPYDFEYFRLDNSFQGGVFQKVRQLTMIDKIPFKDKLFKFISQDFPFLEILSIETMFPLEDNQHSSTPITFPCLKLLDLKFAHEDYAERFLLKRNMYLPRLSNLCVKYIILILITHIFTKDATNFNFGKVRSLDLCGSFVRPKDFHQYFPLL